MELKPGNICPISQKECIGLQCAWMTQVRGMNPNTGKEVDEWGCAIAWLPLLLIENSQQQRQTGAAVESFRNEVVRQIEGVSNVRALEQKAVYLQGAKG